MAVAAVVATATIKAACGRDLIFRNSSNFVYSSLENDGLTSLPTTCTESICF